VLGVVEIFTVPIDTWEDADVPAYFREQLGFDFHGPRGLPENFVFNTGDENDLLRRAVSTFLSPLGTAYMIVVALLLWAARPRRWWPLGLVAAVGLLFTFTRAALVALAGGLLVLAFVKRSWWPVAAAAATLLVGVVWTQVYPSIAPETTWSQVDLEFQREQARRLGVRQRGERPCDAGGHVGDAAELRRVEVLGQILVRMDRDVGPVVEVDHRHGIARVLEDLVVAAELDPAGVGDERLPRAGRPHESAARIAAAFGVPG
jgi:hypothetical protein